MGAKDNHDFMKGGARENQPPGVEKSMLIWEDNWEDSWRKRKATEKEKL